MIGEIWAVYLRELKLMKTRLPMMLAAAGITPLLYFVAFAMALGGEFAVGGGEYRSFLLPGLVALSSMTQAFSIAGEINIARFYWKVFEEIQASPVRDSAYVAGETLAGVTRGLMAAVVIVGIGLLFGVHLRLGILFWFGVLLNSLVFSALAVALAMVVKEHSTQMMLNTFFITPMAFLGGTFFPVDRLPYGLQAVLSLLPITHASRAIRRAALDDTPDVLSWALLALLFALFFLLATRLVQAARD